MSTTITLPQLRTALHLLGANISAEALFAALKPARVQTPDKARTLAHYETEAAIARAMLAEPAGFCGPMRQLQIEDAAFAITGSKFSQPIMGQLREEFFGADCGALDAPDYVPLGGVTTTHGNGGSFVLATCTESREVMGRLAAAAEQSAHTHAWADDDMVYA